MLFAFRKLLFAYCLCSWWLDSSHVLSSVWLISKSDQFLAHRRTRRDLRIDDLPTEDDSCIVMCSGLIGLSRKIRRRRIPWQQSANANAHWHDSSEGSCRNTHGETTSSVSARECPVWVPDLIMLMPSLGATSGAPGKNVKGDSREDVGRKDNAFTCLAVVFLFRQSREEKFLYRLHHVCIYLINPVSSFSIWSLRLQAS